MEDIRAELLAEGLIDEARVQEYMEQLRAEMRAYRLVEIREALGLNQTAVAATLGVSQSRISRLERGEMNRTEIATIRAYVAALGGEIEIIAKFGDERITIA